MTALDPKLLEAAAASLIAGRSRGAPPLDALFGAAAEGRALDALALAGQARRFRRPAPPETFDEADLVEDARAIVSDEARGLMLRLLTGKGADPQEAPARAIAFALEAKRLRPHPFDLPRLEAFVRAHAELLGATVLAWTTRGEEPRPSHFEPDAVDESNWLTVAPFRQAQFIARVRARDPNLARDMVAAAFPSLKADARARLLETLAAGLSEADEPFLESLAGDRAPKVKELAARLLTALPGSEGLQKQIDDFASRIKISKAGIPLRPTALELETPADVPAHFVHLWAAAAMSPFPLDRLAAHFSMSIDEICAAAKDDTPLLLALAVGAMREKRAELLAGLIRQAPLSWHFVVEQAIERNYENFSRRFNWPFFGRPDFLCAPEEVEPMCAALLQPEFWEMAPQPAAFRPLQTMLCGALPESVARKLLEAKFWREMLAKEEPDALTLTALASLTPKALRSQIRDQFSRAAPGYAARALLALDCLDSLDAP
jgi:hypothetical protein